jgi:hypothetical protein
MLQGRLEDALNVSEELVDLTQALSNTGYSLGKGLAEFVSSFLSQYRNPSETAKLLPQPLDSIRYQVDETIQQLFFDFNAGSNQHSYALYNIRDVVESFLFGKLNLHILAIYESAFEDLAGKLKAVQKTLNALPLQSLATRFGLHEIDDLMVYS